METLPQSCLVREMERDSLKPNRSTSLRSICQQSSALSNRTLLQEDEVATALTMVGKPHRLRGQSQRGLSMYGSGSQLVKPCGLMSWIRLAPTYRSSHIQIRPHLRLPHLGLPHSQYTSTVALQPQMRHLSCMSVRTKVRSHSRCS